MGGFKFKFYPAQVMYALNTLLALIVSFGFISSDLSKTVEVVATAVCGLVVAFFTHPPAIAAIQSGVAAVLVGVAGFGLHFSDAQIAAVTAAVSLLVAYFSHQLNNNAATKAGTTVEQIQRDHYRKARVAA